MGKYDFIKDLQEGEECREVRGFPDYFITTYGRLWSNKKRGRDRNPYGWIKPTPTHKYYWSITLKTPEGKRVGQKIHSLVGRNFHPDYKEGLFVLHLKEDLPYPEINYLSNLWIGTNQDNMKDMYTKGRYVMTEEHRKLRRKVGRRCWDNLSPEEQKRTMERVHQGRRNKPGRRKYYYVYKGKRYESIKELSKETGHPEKYLDNRFVRGKEGYERFLL